MSPYFIAVDLGGTQIRAALCGMDGQIYRKIIRKTEAREGQDPVLARIYASVSEAIGDTPGGEIVAVGLGAPGPVDPRSGMVLGPPNLPGWQSVPLRSLLSAQFGRPTFIGNDANVAALAEHLYGAGRGIQDMIYLTISTGIGGGVISSGKLLLGHRGLAAEIGHTIILPDGPTCGCGAHGCLEALAAGPAIARDVVSRLKAGKESRIPKMVKGDLTRVDARVVNEAAQLGDKLAINAFRRAGTYLGIACANLLRVFNPHMLVFGGSVTKAGALLFDPMREALAAHVPQIYLDGLAIAPAALGDDVGLLGALALAVTEMEGGVQREAALRPETLEGRDPIADGQQVGA